MFSFATPLWFLALLTIPLILWLRKRRPAPVLLVPNAATWYRPTLTTLSRWPATLATTGIIFLIAALARPQIVEDKREVHTEGYDLMLAIDLSGSMIAEDYQKPDGTPLNRLQTIKPVIQAFITERPSDRIGIVLFAGRCYTLAPLTFDHAWLAQQIERLKIGVVPESGSTAIGDGLGLALSRLQQARHESSTSRKGAFVILLTDGVNNTGTLTPEQSAEVAKSRGIPVYTIGAGRNGIVNVPVHDPTSGARIGTRREMSEIDEVTLQQIAKTTNGHYYSAQNSRTIRDAFADINKSQKIEFESKTYVTTTELFPWLLIPALLLLSLSLPLHRRQS